MTRLEFDPIVELDGYRLLAVCETTLTSHGHGTHFFISGSKAPVAIICQKDGQQSISLLDETCKADVLKAIRLFAIDKRST